MCRNYWFEGYRPKRQGGTNFSRRTNNVLQVLSTCATLWTSTSNDITRNGSLLNCVPYVPTCQRALRAYVPCVLTCSRPNVSCMLTMCSGANVSCVLKCSSANVFCVLTSSRALRANVPYMPCMLTCSRALYPLRAYVLTFLACLRAHVL